MVRRSELQKTSAMRRIELLRLTHGLLFIAFRLSSAAGVEITAPSPSSSSGGGGGLVFDECTLHLEQLLLNTSRVPG